MDWTRLCALCWLCSLAHRCWCFPLSVEELEEEITTAGEVDDSNEKKYTTNSWNFDEYTSSGYRTAAAAAAAAASGIEDELHALRKVSEILLLLGEQVIPIIIGDPVNDRCAKKKDEFGKQRRKETSKG